MLRNAYGTSGWLSAVTTTPSGGSQVNLLTNLTYGGPALQLTGASEGNGTYTYAASYDNDGRQTNSHLTRTSDSATIFRSARTYDATGNVTGVTTTLTTGTDNQAFCYDALDRLVWAGSTGTPSCGGTLTAGTLTSAQYTQTFGYDTLTRLTSITSSGATGASPGSYTYGDSAHLHAATATAGGYSATYDAVGDMVCRAPTSATTCTGGSPTGAQLAYDAERRLTHSQNLPGASPDVEAWYLYDGAGNRVEQAVKQSGVTTSTYYLAGGAEEVRSDSTLIKYYGSLGLNTGATASTISYLASDGLGSLQVTLNGSGSATALQLNAPYGSVRYSSGVFPTTKGFTGQRSDAAVSGLDYYGARYYDPALGQFTSGDSMLDGLSRYGYVSGNPTTLTDPSGHGQDEPPYGAGGPKNGGGVAISLDGVIDWLGNAAAAVLGGMLAGIPHAGDAGGPATSYHTLNCGSGAHCTFHPKVTTGGGGGGGGTGHGHGGGGQGGGGGGTGPKPSSPITTGPDAPAEPEAEPEPAAQPAAGGRMARHCTPEEMELYPEACGVFKELYGLRGDLGMIQDPGTLVRLDVGGISTYGVNTHGLQDTIQPLFRTSYQTAKHAEGLAFYTAYLQGISGGTGTLYVDRSLCGFCGKSGGVRKMVKGLGLSRLTVYELLEEGGIRISDIIP